MNLVIVSPVIVLGSQSPRRLSLLQSLYGPDRVLSMPPRNPDEPGFAGLSTDEQINQRLRQIVRRKYADVKAQLDEDGLQSGHHEPAVVVAADTTIVVPSDHGRIVLGQPHPESWQSEVRDWLQNHLSGRSHDVRTCVLAACGREIQEILISTEVTFRPLTPEMIDWYLSTEESPGKAGGYAVQGHAAALVQSISGSLTSVIGLPLLETRSLINSVLDAETRHR